MSSSPSAPSWTSLVSDASSVDGVRGALESVSAAVGGVELKSRDFASAADQLDSLATFRSQFSIPKARDIAQVILNGQKEEERGVIPESVTPDQDSVYLCGNSLGLLPHLAQTYVQEELAKWARLGVEAHFDGARPWALIDEPSTALSIPVVGAVDESEIAIMNSLSANLHLLLVTFYRPSATRFKILIEAEAFCSDHHVVRSQVALHGRTVEEGIVSLVPREGETTLRTEDILDAIAREGDSLALVLLPGVQFYTGQCFDMGAITKAGHAVGAYVGFDLAHAVGNVPLRLHEWQVDFAAWCSYKYLNSGPGAIGGAFVHQMHHGSDQLKLKGWWGQTLKDRFSMKAEHVEKPGAQSYMLSNPPVLPAVCMQASLEVHKQAGQAEMRAKSVVLTAYLEYLLREIVGATGDQDGPLVVNPSPTAPITVRVLTPSLPSARGCQLSLLFSCPVKSIFRALTLRGVVTDVREPNVLRVSPTPLYNTFRDVRTFVELLDEVLRETNKQRAQQ